MIGQYRGSRTSDAELRGVAAQLPLVLSDSGKESDSKLAKPWRVLGLSIMHERARLLGYKVPARPAWNGGFFGTYRNMRNTQPDVDRLMFQAPWDW